MTFDAKKLGELRAKYLDSPGGEIFDPKFKKVGEKIFDKSGTRVAPYAGIPTLLDAPYRPLPAENPDFGDLQVAMIGMPMDLGVTNRPGSRFGPRALRAIERVGPYNHVMECAPTHELRVADIGDVAFRSRSTRSSTSSERSLCETRLATRRALLVAISSRTSRPFSFSVRPV